MRRMWLDDIRLVKFFLMLMAIVIVGINISNLMDVLINTDWESARNGALSTIAGTSFMIIATIPYFSYCLSLKKPDEGEDGFSVITDFVRCFGISSVFLALSLASLSYISNQYVLYLGIVMAFIGIVALYLHVKITDGVDTLIDKIVWFLLMAVFGITLAIGTILSVCTFVLSIVIPEMMIYEAIVFLFGFCLLILSWFMLGGLRDGNIKRRFGFKDEFESLDDD